MQWRSAVEQSTSYLIQCFLLLWCCTLCMFDCLKLSSQLTWEPAPFVCLKCFLLCLSALKLKPPSIHLLVALKPLLPDLLHTKQCAFSWFVFGTPNLLLMLVYCFLVLSNFLLNKSWTEMLSAVLVVWQIPHLQQSTTRSQSSLSTDDCGQQLACGSCGFAERRGREAEVKCELILLQNFTLMAS